MTEGCLGLACSLRGRVINELRYSTSFSMYFAIVHSLECYLLSHAALKNSNLSSRLHGHSWTSHNVMYTVSTGFFDNYAFPNVGPLIG